MNVQAPPAGVGRTLLTPAALMVHLPRPCRVFSSHKTVLGENVKTNELEFLSSKQLMIIWKDLTVCLFAFHQRVTVHLA